MIDKLTKEQEEKLIEYRDKWIRIGPSTDFGDALKLTVSNFDAPV